MGIKILHFYRQDKKFFREARENFSVNTTENGITNKEGKNTKKKSEPIKEEKKWNKESILKSREETIGKILSIGDEKISETNIANLTAKQRQALERYTESEIKEVVEKKFNYSKSTSQRVISVLEDEEKSTAQLFIKQKGNPIKDFIKFIASVPPQKIFTKYLTSSEARNIYLKSLKKIPKGGSYALLLQINVATFPEFLNADTLSRTEKEKFLGIIHDIHKTQRNEIIAEILDEQGVLEQMTNSTKKDLNDTLLEHTTISSKEEKMKQSAKKILTPEQFKNLEEELQKNSEENKSYEKTFKIYEQAFQESLKDYIHLKDQSYSNMLSRINRQAYVLKEFASCFATVTRDKILKDIEAQYPHITEFIELLQKGSKNEIARFLIQNDKMDIQAQEQIENIETQKPNILRDFFDYSKKYTASVMYIHKYTQEIKEELPITDKQKAKSIATEIHNKLATPNNNYLTIGINTLENYLIYGGEITPYDCQGAKNIISKHSYNSSLSKDEFNTLANSPESIINTIPESILEQYAVGTDGIHQELNRGTKEFYRKNFAGRQMKNISQALDSAEKKFFDEIKNSGDLSQEIREQYTKRITEDPENIEKCTVVIDEIITLLKLANPPSINQTSIVEELLKEKENIEKGLEQVPKHKANLAKNLTEFSKKPDSKIPILEGLEESERGEDILAKWKEKQKEIESIPINQRGQYFSKTLQENKKEPLHAVTQNSHTLWKDQVDQITGHDGIINIFQKLNSTQPLRQKDAKILLSLRNIHGADFLQPLTSLSTNEENKYKINSNEEISFFADDTDTLYIPNGLYKEIVQLNQNTHPFAAIEKNKQVNDIFHEASHFLFKYSNAVSDFDTLLQEKNIDFETLGTTGIQDEKGNNIILNLHVDKNNKAGQTEELLAILAGGKPYPTEIQEEITFLESMIGKENIQNILNTAKEHFAQNYKNQHKISPNQKFASRSTTGSGSVEQAEQEKEILKAHERETILRKFEGQEKSMEETLRDFRKFRSQVSGDQKNKIDAWDQWFKDQMEADKNYLTYGKIDTKDADEVIRTYHLSDNKGPRYKLNEMMIKLSESTIPEQSYLGNLWQGTRFLSMTDIGRIWDTTWEFVKRRHETKAKGRVGQAGQSMFSGIVPSLASEFDKEAENAEKTEVGEIQDALGNKNTPDVYGFMQHAGKIEDVKAALQELASRGLLNFNNPIIWKSLYKHGSGVTFYGSDFQNRTVRDSKFQKALINIWGDQDMYQSLSSQNDGAENSGIQKYEKAAASKMNALPGYLNSWITNNKKGIYVDPHEYEAYTRTLKQAGKGSPASPLYYMIIGIAQGIIPPEAATRFDNDFANNYALSHLFDSDPSMADYKQWAEEILYDPKKNVYRNPADGVPSNFRHWITKNVFTKPSVLSRTVINQGKPDSIDHDHAVLLLSVGEAEHVDSMLAFSSNGSQNFKTSMFNNITAGILEYTTSLALQQKSMPKEIIRENIAREFGYFAAFDGATGGRRNTSDKIKFTFGENNLKTPPREGANYNGAMSTNDYLEAGREIFAGVPEDLDGGIFKYFLKNIAFNTNKSVKGDNYYEGMKAEFVKLREHPNYNSTIGPALEKAGMTEPDRMGKQLYSVIIPAVINYFLLNSKHKDLYLDSILQKAKDVSAGKGDYKKWANNNDPNNMNLSEEKRGLPLPVFPDTSKVGGDIKIGEE